MALSGSQKTQVGRQYSGTGKKQAFSPKSPGVAPTETILDYERGMTRGVMRGIARGMR